MLDTLVKLKVCRRCADEKPLTDFNKGSDRYGKQSYCKRCAVDVNRERIARDPERQRIIQKRNHLKKYGLTLEEYQSRLEAQDGKCAICFEGPDGIGRQYGHLAVDHDHETGVVRGLLCSKCNTALGLLRDDCELIRAAAAYLECHIGGGSDA